MNTQIQVNSVSEERAWFYSTFESALKSEVEKIGGQVDTFYSKNNPSIVQAFSVKFSDSPVATTIYPEPLCRRWQEGLSILSLVDSVMRSARQEKLLDFSDYVLRHENAATHLKASLVKVEEAENWLKTVPHEKHGDTAIVADWYFNDTDKITIHNNTLGMLQMTREEVLAQAKLNSSLELPTFKNTKTNINNLDISLTVADEPMKIPSIGDTHRHRR